MLVPANQSTRPRSPTMTSPPVPPSMTSSPWPPKITSGSVESWPCTRSSSASVAKLDPGLGDSSEVRAMLTTTKPVTGPPVKVSCCPLTWTAFVMPLTVAVTESPLWRVVTSVSVLCAARTAVSTYVLSTRTPIGAHVVPAQTPLSNRPTVLAPALPSNRPPPTAVPPIVTPWTTSPGRRSSPP